MNKTLQSELTAIAHQLADLSRPIALEYFRSDMLGLENKDQQAFDPVTIADREIEQAMRAHLASVRPDDGILGEEFEHKSGTSGLTWVLDPIDGTRGFMSGTPTWGVLIAVSDETGPLIGLIDQPFTQERFLGTGDAAVWMKPPNEMPLKTRNLSDLSDAVLFTTYPEVGTPAERAAFERVKDQVKLTRYGTDCYAYGLLAAGQVDLVIEAGLNPYDIQAPIAVVQSAGGIVTNWNGGPAHSGGTAIAAGSAELHRQALELLNA